MLTVIFDGMELVLKLDGLTSTGVDCNARRSKGEWKKLYLEKIFKSGGEKKIETNEKKIAKA